MLGVGAGVRDMLGDKARMSSPSPVLSLQAVDAAKGMVSSLPLRWPACSLKLQLPIEPLPLNVVCLQQLMCQFRWPQSC